MTGKKALPANFFVRQMTVSVKRMLLMTLLFCGAFMIQPSSSYRIDKVTERGTLRVIGVAGPTTFLPHGAEGARGLQYELLRKFAEELHIKLEITQAPNAAAVIKALRSGSADIGITGLASRDLRLKTLLLSQPYLQEQQQLIERSNDSSVSDTPQIAVGKNSIAQQQLALIEPNANLLAIGNASPDELLMKLEDGSVDYAVINEAEFEARRAAFPELKTKTVLSEVKLAWAMGPQDQHLLKLANYFLQQSTQDGSLQRLTRFYSQGETFNNVGVKTFQRDMQARLPLYKTKFEQQAQKHSIDWRLLAAIGYQESKWNANAISPTGVSGLMMLTKDTAAEMGIKNRDNPTQSIQAGAAYYQLMTQKFSDTVREPDRTWMALAAYNMGYGNIIKAQKITQKMGNDPTKWLDVSRHLRQLPRAGQALVYVQEVRRYYDALLLTTTKHSWVASIEKQQRVVQ